ncbi:MAG: transposase family protein, partial [Gammaproteobacteria bacterium]|nr:transposase family protein [Gammaproteobacteria bacterium]
MARNEHASEKFVQHCVVCQRSSKSAPNDNIPISEIPSPTKPWEQLAIDISGTYFNDNYIMVLIDYYSKFPEILSTKTITSTYIINWLREIFARYGNPGAIVSDNGPQFISREFTDFLASKDIYHYRTGVYNPSENG